MDKTTPPPKTIKSSRAQPDDTALLAYLEAHRGCDLSDICRHFGLKGDERRIVRHRLKALSQAGNLEKTGRKSFQSVGSLPETGAATIIHKDEDGELWAQWGREDDQKSSKSEPPLARLIHKTDQAPKLGDRVFVRFERQSDAWTAKLIKILDQGGLTLVGVARKRRIGFELESVHRKNKGHFRLSDPLPPEVLDGSIIIARIPHQPSHKFGPKMAKLIEIVGHIDDARSSSIMAVASQGIQLGFHADTESEAIGAALPELGKREDLRDLGFVTIDPQDARDHDDAVFATPDPNPQNKGGVIIWVAIADVAYYVTAGSSLDKDARTKGNSTYFPDRVEPMLPHALSSNLCSLREGEDRAAMVVRMVFDREGHKLHHKFTRALIRTRAKLSYEAAQALFDGVIDPKDQALWDEVLEPLWQAHLLLTKGRERRNPLNIHAPERRVHLDDEGHIIAIVPRLSLPSHLLIEEMMIQANVSAAQTLVESKTPLLFRVHEPPSLEKSDQLADFLATCQIPWSRGEPPSTQRFNRLLAETKEGEHEETINEVVLRTQMQAHYSPENLHHFGLNLLAYAHFTSPIRRYADLIVHRGLIRALGLGTDGLTDYEIKTLQDTAEHITSCERRSMAAERESLERMIASYLSDKIGARFMGRILGVTRFGLFVKLDETGADGLVPISSLGEEFFFHDERAHALVGERSRNCFRLGMRVEVSLTEAAPVSGGLVFQMQSPPIKATGSMRAPLSRRREAKGKPSYGKNKGAKKRR